MAKNKGKPVQPESSEEEDYGSEVEEESGQDEM